jgi:hypothetical protein
MAKYRSKINFGTILAGDKEGYNLGIDGYIFIRPQSSRTVFQPPRVGTQGLSTSGATPSTDISAGTDNKFNASVDGKSPLLVTLTVAGKTSGSLIAAELELKINTALIAAGYDERVWAEYTGSVYKIYSQSTGASSAVVITDALTDNIADALKIGVLNTGVETLGTDDQDFLLYTEGGAKYAQPIETSAHRSGRFLTSIITKKITADFDLTTLINMSGLAGDSLDNAIRTLLKGACGKETVTPNLAIDYEQDDAINYFSLVKASTIFAEYYTGCYVKDFTLTQPGDAPGTYQFVGMAKKASSAGIGKVFGAVVASTDVILDDSVYPHVERFTEGARVMVVGTDGRTVLYGVDGSLYVSSIDLALNKLVLSSAISCDDQSYIVFWHPGCVQTTSRDNIYTDLQGSFKFSPTEPAICATNIVLGITNDHIDKMNCFGSDSNEGGIAGNRAVWNLSVTFDLSNDVYGKLLQAETFAGFQPELIIGDSASSRYLKITAPKWIPAIPAKEIPANGTTPITLEGSLYQSEGGAKDCVKLSFL